MHIGLSNVSACITRYVPRGHSGPALRTTHLENAGVELLNSSRIVMCSRHWRPDKAMIMTESRDLSRISRQGGKRHATDWVSLHTNTLQRRASQLFLDLHQTIKVFLYLDSAMPEPSLQAHLP